MLKAINDMVVIRDIKIPEQKTVNLDLSFTDNVANNYPIMALAGAEVIVADYLSVHRVLKNSFGKPLVVPGDIVFFQKEKVIKFQLPSGKFITAITHKDILFITKEEI